MPNKNYIFHVTAIQENNITRDFVVEAPGILTAIDNALNELEPRERITNINRSDVYSGGR